MAVLVLCMISSTVELMAKKEDFSQLEEICMKVKQTGQNTFKYALREPLDEVPLDVIKNLNLTEEAKKGLRLNGYLIGRKLKESSDLTSFFEKLSVEDFQLVRADSHLNNLVSDDTSATKLVDKVNEVKNDKFATNAFVVLVKKGLDSSALQVYNDLKIQ